MKPGGPGFTLKPALIGVLALQGAFREHARIFRELGAEVREVRLAADLAGLDGLAMPGGESTTMGKLLVDFDLLEPLARFAAERPVFATCAGLIVLSLGITTGEEQPLLHLLDVEVERNGFGRQVYSFEAPVKLLPPLAAGGERYLGIFIRAPRIVTVGPKAQVIASLDGEPVGVLQDNIFALSFHPELSRDWRLHSYFLDHIVAAKKRSAAKAEARLAASSMSC